MLRALLLFIFMLPVWATDWVVSHPSELHLTPQASSLVLRHLNPGEVGEELSVRLGNVLMRFKDGDEGWVRIGDMAPVNSDALADVPVISRSEDIPVDTAKQIAQKLNQLQYKHEQLIQSEQRNWFLVGALVVLVGFFVGYLFGRRAHRQSQRTLW